MAASRRKKTKATAAKIAPPAARTGILTTLGDRIKKIATGLVKRTKKKRPTKKAGARKKRAPRARKPSP